MKKSEFPAFRTERLILRGITEADAVSYEENFATYDVIGELTRGIPWPYPKGGVLEYIRTDVLPKQGIEAWVWGIALKNNPDEVICSIPDDHIDPRRSAFFMARSVLRDIRSEVRAC